MSNSATPRPVSCQAPLSMRFSRQEYWSGLPFPSPGDLPDPGIQPGPLATEVTWHGTHTYACFFLLSVYPFIHTCPSISHYFSFSGVSWLPRCLSPLHLWSLLGKRAHWTLARDCPQRLPAPLWALARCPLWCLICSLRARDPVCPSHHSLQLPSPHRTSLSSRERSVTVLCSEGPGRAPNHSSRVHAKTCVCVHACTCVYACTHVHVCSGPFVN